MMPSRSRSWVAGQSDADVQFGGPVVLNFGNDLELEACGGYRRCMDFDQSGAKGQDYAALKVSESHVVGVVVDGVSQSFHGEIAALKLGESLVKLLWRYRDNPLDAAALAVELNDVVVEVAELLREVSLPGSEESILWKALEKTRLKGGQAVFAAFVLEAESKRLTLYQLGDIRSWVRMRSDWEEQPTDPMARWSSIGCGHTALTRTERFDIAGIFLHSDGLSATVVKEQGGPPPSMEIFRPIAETCAARDDVSFVAVLLRPASYGSRLSQIDAPAELHREESPDSSDSTNGRQQLQTRRSPPPPPVGARGASRSATLGRVLLVLMSFLIGFGAGFATGRSPSPSQAIEAKPLPPKNPPPSKKNPAKADGDPGSKHVDVTEASSSSPSQGTEAKPAPQKPKKSPKTVGGEMRSDQADSALQTSGTEAPFPSSLDEDHI